MYRVINFESLKSKVKPLWDRRLGRDYLKVFSLKRMVSDYQGSVAFNFIVSGKKIAVDEGVFLACLLGFKRFTDSGADVSGITGEEKKAMDIIFPEMLPVYWDFDYL